MLVITTDHRCKLASGHCRIMGVRESHPAAAVAVAEKVSISQEQPLDQHTLFKPTTATDRLTLALWLYKLERCVAKGREKSANCQKEATCCCLVAGVVDKRCSLLQIRITPQPWSLHFRLLSSDNGFNGRPSAHASAPARLSLPPSSSILFNQFQITLPSARLACLQCFSNAQRSLYITEVKEKIDHYTGLELY